MPIPLVVGAALAAGQIISTVVGGIQAGNARREAEDRARRAMDEALAIIDSTGAPPDLSQKIIMQKFQQAGLLTPEVEQAISVGVSKASQITEDSALREAQTDALKTMSERGRLGLTAEDRASLNKVRNDVQRDVEAKRQQILQNFAARGQGGSGSELIAALNASQSGANLASEQGDRIAAQASRNALEAMTRAGDLGGRIRAQDFEVANSKARAADEMRRFDIANRIGVQTRNVANLNQANRANLENKQRIADMNINQENQELLRQNEAKRQRWLDQLEMNKAKANARTGQANAAIAAGARNAQGIADTTKGINSAIGTVGTFLGGMGGGSGGPTPSADAAAIEASADDAVKLPASYDYGRGYV